MAKRMIDTDMWLDSQIVDDFTKDDIHLWLYILTSPRTTICGVLKNSKTIMSIESKMRKEELEDSLYNLEYKHKVIKYNEENDEILILKWHKHNWTKSSTLIKCLKEQVEKIKTEEFKAYVETKISLVESLK
jgi:hypothetical protein